MTPSGHFQSKQRGRGGGRRRASDVIIRNRVALFSNTAATAGHDPKAFQAAEDKAIEQGLPTHVALPIHAANEIIDPGGRTTDGSIPFSSTTSLALTPS